MAEVLSGLQKESLFRLGDSVAVSVVSGLEGQLDA